MDFAASVGHASHTTCGGAQSDSHAVSSVMVSPGAKEKPAASQCATTHVGCTSTTVAHRRHVRKPMAPPIPALVAPRCDVSAPDDEGDVDDGGGDDDDEGDD